MRRRGSLWSVLVTVAVVVAGLMVLSGAPTGSLGSMGSAVGGLLEDLVDGDQAAEAVDLDVAPARVRRATRWVGGLEVADREAAGYDRDLFEHWVDEDGDGLDTREEILERDLVDGRLDPGPYTGQPITYDPDDTTSVHIDHVRALGDAWEGGADEWTAARRRTFANDPTNLLAVDGTANMAKGDDSPGEWRPENRGAWCLYAVMYVETSHRYELSVDAGDQTALRNMLDRC